MEIKFESKFKEVMVFRELKNSDETKLGNFFDTLSNDTRSKFGPHPLTKEYASILCKKIGDENIKRFIVLSSTDIIGYFILDFNFYEHETARYLKFGITLDSKIDPVFAPCIADNYQNKGIASQVMKIILDYAQLKKLRSIVLMGGTQEPNKLAQSFYKKFGFKEYDRFYTDHNGLNNIDMMLRLQNK